MRGIGVHFSCPCERFRVSPSSFWSRWLSTSALYRTLRNVFLQVQVARRSPQEIPAAHRTHVDGGVLRVSAEDYAADLQRMVERVREGGAEPVFLVLPTFPLMRGSVPPEVDPPHRGVMRSLAASLDVPLVDGDLYFRGLRWSEGLFLDPIHPGPEGARILAERIDATLASEAIGPQTP